MSLARGDGPVRHGPGRSQSVSLLSDLDLDESAEQSREAWSGFLHKLNDSLSNSYEAFAKHAPKIVETFAKQASPTYSMMKELSESFTS